MLSACRCVVPGLKDRPSYLSAPRGFVGSVVWADDVILAYGPLDRQRVPRYVPGQRAVGNVDVRVGARMHDDRNFDCRYDERPDPPHRAHGSAAGHENRCCSKRVREQSVRKNATRRPGGFQALRCQGGAQFAERALIPG